MMRYFVTMGLLLTLAPGLAQAEGDRRVVSCQATKICDESGACKPGNRLVTLGLTPIKRGPNGEGAHWIDYDGQKYKADNVTGRGPIVWSTDGADVQTLLYAGENETIWHRLTPAPQAHSSLEFFNCKDAS